MIVAALRRSPMVSNSGETISAVVAWSSSVPRSRPASFSSTSTSSRSLTLSVCEMMQWRSASRPKRRSISAAVSKIASSFRLASL